MGAVVRLLLLLFVPTGLMRFPIIVVVVFFVTDSAIVVVVFNEYT